MTIQPSKMVYGDQIQIRLDPSQLEAKNRGQWAQIYLQHQADRARMFLHASTLFVGSMISTYAAVNSSSFFLFFAVVFGFYSVKSFYAFGYKKGILDDWDSKIMVRMDK